MSDTRNKNGNTVTLAYIETIITRFEKAERYIDADIKQMERRMQQLAELVRSVSAVQHQVTSQQQTLQQLRTEVRDNMAQLEDLFHGSNGRYLENFAAVNEKIEATERKRDELLKKRDEHAATSDALIYSWRGRFTGAWAILALVFGTVQYAGMRYIDGLQEERDALILSTSQLASRLGAIEARQRAIERILSSTTTNR